VYKLSQYLMLLQSAVQKRRAVNKDVWGGNYETMKNAMFL
jgi:hypothetical protein